MKNSSTYEIPLGSFYLLFIMRPFNKLINSTDNWPNQIFRLFRATQVVWWNSSMIVTKPDTDQLQNYTFVWLLLLLLSVRAENDEAHLTMLAIFIFSGHFHLGFDQKWGWFYNQSRQPNAIKRGPLPFFLTGWWDLQQQTRECCLFFLFYIFLDSISVVASSLVSQSAEKESYLFLLSISLVRLDNSTNTFRRLVNEAILVSLLFARVFLFSFLAIPFDFKRERKKG